MLFTDFTIVNTILTLPPHVATQKFEALELMLRKAHAKHTVILGVLHPGAT